MEMFSFSSRLLCIWIWISAQQLTCNCAKSKYIKFSNQRETVLDEARNFATLQSGGSGVLPSNIFTICGSIYIGYFRSEQNFYTLRGNDQKILLISLNILHQDIAEERYDSTIYYFGGNILPNPGRKLRLRPHAWSYACTTMDVESNHMLVVINGILTHNTTITSINLTDNVPKMLQGNLIIGTIQTKFAGQPDVVTQSEASVTNVNIFSTSMNISQMVHITSTGECRDGDVVSWPLTTWTFTGHVEEVTQEDICKPSHFPHLYKMAGGFPSWSDCMEL